MRVLRPTDVRNRWKQILRTVADGEEEIRILLNDDRSVLMFSADLYESLWATIETLSDPAAMRAIRKHRAGNGNRYTLRDIDRLIDGHA